MRTVAETDEADEDVTWSADSDEEITQGEDVVCDYLVVGAGAMGMAFADEIVHKSNCSVVIVDIRKSPGGRLHEAVKRGRLLRPSSSLLSCSTPVSSPTVSGSEAGDVFFPMSTNESGDEMPSTPLAQQPPGTPGQPPRTPGAWFPPPTPYALNSRPLDGFLSEEGATSSEATMLEYYKSVLQDLEDTGRVRFFPEASYFNKLLRSVSGKVWKVRATKVVMANYGEARSKQAPLPSLQGITVCMPEDPLVRNDAPEYLVVGGGKTAMEAVLWLLKKEVDPEAITWILPHDTAFWLRERKPPATPKSKARQVSREVGTEKFQTQADLKKFQCAALSNRELKDLGSVTNIVRLGHVMGAEPSRLILERGQVPLQPGVVVLDCNDSLQDHKAVPIWQPGKLVLQTLANCRRAKSAALIAAIELQPGRDEEKNLFKPARPGARPTSTLPQTSPKVERKMLDMASPPLKLFRNLPRPAPPQRGSLPLPPPPPKAKPLQVLDSLLESGYPFEGLSAPTSPKER
mmetsp:Transcript_31682/g.57711  ORF Transcript_31682/g.57711 Transcript_31682/m.57711 type:complete len:517 (-) Transcript_31682:223-1773(-)